MENNPLKSAYREKLSLRGLRSNATRVPSPPPSRKKELLVKSAYGKIDFLPPTNELIRHNGTENAIRFSTTHAIPVKSDGLREWTQKQATFITNLSKRDREILSSYSAYGDTLVNNYIRGSLTDIEDIMNHFGYLTFLRYYLYDQYDAFKGPLRLPPREQADKAFYGNELTIDANSLIEIMFDNIDFFSNPANIAPLLEAYKQDLIRIIAAAPRLTQPLTVYRGFKSEAHLKGLEYENNDFISTSLYLPSALDFSECYRTDNKPELGCIDYIGGVYEITIDKQIPCVYMEPNTLVPGEFEILLPPGLHFTFDSKIYYKKFSNPLFEKGTNELRVVIIHATVRPVHPMTVVPYAPGGIAKNAIVEESKISSASGGGRKSRNRFTKKRAGRTR